MAKTTQKTYSKAFKLEVLRDYYSSGMSKMMTARKWGLSSHVYIIRWIREFQSDLESVSLPAELLSVLTMEKEEKTREQLLEEEVLRLKKALELEKLRSHAFRKLIETAEKEEGICILKKDGAKQ